MLRKIKCYAKLISLAVLVVLVAYGCRNSSQNQNSAQTKNESQETKSLTTPQFELIETPKYKDLKKQVEEARNEANEFKVKMERLKAVYTEEYSAVKKASRNFAEAKKKLVELEKSLNAETEKLEKRQINMPV